MIDGLKFITEGGDHLEAIAWDNEKANGRFDTEEDFLANAGNWEKDGYRLYYFGEDGAMRTGKTIIEIDGENFTFEFGESGSKKGQGITGEDDDRFYQSGMLLKAGSDEKYQVIKPGYEKVLDENGKEVMVNVLDAEGDVVKQINKTYVASYGKYEDAEAFYSDIPLYGNGDIGESVGEEEDAREFVKEKYGVDIEKLNRDGDEIDELYVINWDQAEREYYNWKDYRLINKSGKVVDNDTRSMDGEGYVYVTDDNGKILAIYSEE